MIEKSLSRKLSLRAVLVGLPLMLAACASDDGPSKYEPTPTSYFSVPARPGDSVSDLAKHYRVDEEDILALNDISDSKKAAPKTWRVPAYGRPRDLRQSEPVTASDVVTPNKKQTENRGRDSSRVAVVTPLPKPRAKLAAPTALAAPASTSQPAQEKSWIDREWFSSFLSKTPEPKPGTVKFDWPARGRVISNFGGGKAGVRNDGINIAIARGTPVRAAADGTVTYVGDELKGYGNLVLIRHDNGFVTAYAHSDSVVVQRGARVTLGQIISYAGTSGDVDRPQLHFEMRIGSKPVDPAPYFVERTTPTRVASRADDATKGNAE